MFFFKQDKNIKYKLKGTRQPFFLQVQGKTRKRTSQSASKTRLKERFLKHGWSGSMTVETALVFPFFIFAIYAVFCINQVFITSHEMQNGLVETARYAAKYAYAQKETLTSQQVLKWQFMKYADESCLTQIRGGAKKIRISLHEEDAKEGMLCLKADAKLTLTIPLLGDYTIPLQEVVHQKKFIGFVEGEKTGEQSDYVYIAETGSVYHTSLSCTHICIQIVPASSIANIGQRTCCKHCMKDGKLHGNYATIYGDCIHNNINCSGIKRTVRVVKKEQVSGMPLCTKCAQNGG